MKKLLVIPFILFLAGCTSTETISLNNNPAESGIKQNEAFTTAETEKDYGHAFEQATKMQLFLYEDMSVATFEGEGNEFASYTVKTNWLNDTYVRYEQDNGGVVLAKYYRVLADGIYLIDQTADEVTPKTVTELEPLPVISTVLIPPIEVGATFDGWVITSIDTQYATAYENFDQVIVLEKVTDGIKERQFYVAGVGAIAYEFELINEDGDKTVITSKLASIRF